jgi:hypothetical protein
MKSVRTAGFSTLQTAKKLLASFAAGMAAVAAIATVVHAQEAGSQPRALTVLNYVTGWTHDAVGYHPALFMLLENSGGRDLSNKLIRFQARFTDLRTAEVTIGRSELRRELKPHQQISLAIEGEQGYELPFEIHQWPTIEAKAMCRVGDTGDEGTETLTIAKVDAVARTTNDAFEALNQATSYNPSARRKASAPRVERPVAAVTPLRLPDPTPMKAAPAVKASAERSIKVIGEPGGILGLLNSKPLPGLGDDFYNFEQRFGLPQSFDAKRPDWTFAKYKHPGTGTEIIAGAKDRSGNVDVIVLKVPRSSGVDQSALVNAAKQMAGKLKAMPLSPPSKSVRYLPSGRLELVTSSNAAYKVICLNPEADDADNSFILVLSRVQQDTDVLLPALASKTQLLKCLKFLQAQEAEHD